MIRATHFLSFLSLSLYLSSQATGTLANITPPAAASAAAVGAVSAAASAASAAVLPPASYTFDTAPMPMSTVAALAMPAQPPRSMPAHQPPTQPQQQQQQPPSDAQLAQLARRWASSHGLAFDSLTPAQVDSLKRRVLAELVSPPREREREGQRQRALCSADSHGRKGLCLASVGSSSCGLAPLQSIGVLILSVFFFFFFENSEFELSH